MASWRRTHARITTIVVGRRVSLVFYSQSCPACPTTCANSAAVTPPSIQASKASCLLIEFLFPLLANHGIWPQAEAWLMRCGSREGSIAIASSPEMRRGDKSVNMKNVLNTRTKTLIDLLCSYCLSSAWYFLTSGEADSRSPCAAGGLQPSNR